MNCYNCNSNLHISSNCPEPPKFTRCPGCFSTAQAESGHKHWCANKDFRSSFIGSSAVFELNRSLDIDFRNVEHGFLVKDSKDYRSIGTSKLWLSLVDVFVSSEKPNTLTIETLRPMVRNLLIVNKNDDVVLSILSNRNAIKLNGRYTLNENGSVSVENGISSNEKPSTCYVKVNNINEMFQVHSFLLLVYFMENK